jgi:(p)ppGpp synthase/HD superfamily hydrolase
MVDFGMDETLYKAVQLAYSSHKGQKRTYTGEPYIMHPKRVSELVATVTDEVAILSAAWLHDVVEDTPTTIHDIEQMFGSEIAAYVDDLTNVATRGNREQRKYQERMHLADAHPQAKTIKLADIIDNVQDIVQHDRDFAKVYVEEKRRLLPFLIEGDKELFMRATKIVLDATEELK